MDLGKSRAGRGRACSPRGGPRKAQALPDASLQGGFSAVLPPPGRLGGGRRSAEGPEPAPASVDRAARAVLGPVQPGYLLPGGEGSARRDTARGRRGRVTVRRRTCL